MQDYNFKKWKQEEDPQISITAVVVSTLLILAFGFIVLYHGQVCTGRYEGDLDAVCTESIFSRLNN